MTDGTDNLEFGIPNHLTGEGMVSRVNVGEESLVGPPFPEQDRVRDLRAIRVAVNDLLKTLDSENIECGSCVGKMTEMPNIQTCGNPSHLIIATKMRDLRQLIIENTST